MQLSSSVHDYIKWLHLHYLPITYANYWFVSILPALINHIGTFWAAMSIDYQIIIIIIIVKHKNPGKIILH